ncbi:MAG: OmpA family protein [Candidatus Lindowbacteria bacterium]|nr:OmpA family protein [Candidatus Lindowbacteria bacterium]
MLRKLAAGVGTVFLAAQLGCASTTSWPKENPWTSYPPPGAWPGVGRHASGYWWMPSKIYPEKGAVIEHGNRGVIFYVGEKAAPPAPVVEKPKPPEGKVVERIIYKPIPVRKEVRADRYIFPTITFDEGSAELKSVQKQFDAKKGKYGELTTSGTQVEHAAETIKNSGCETVMVEGNIDSAEAANYPNLGETRAQNVKEALVGLGVRSDALTVKDYGASKPLAASDTEIGRKLNRRVTFTIIPSGQSLEPEKLVQPPAPQVGPNDKVVDKVVEKEVAVPELVITDHIIFANINFEFDKARLTPEGLENTKKAAEALKVMQDINKVTVEGHCDFKGSDAYNDKLSMRRSATVKNQLIKEGIPASKLEAVGYGERQPIADNNTTLGMALNRRVEFKPEYTKPVSTEAQCK